MKRLNIMDCTLRDGGWSNDFLFGDDGMRELVSSIEQAGIEYVELGYLDKKKGSASERSFFADYHAMEHAFEKMNKKSCVRMVMIDCGKFPIEELPDSAETGVLDGIRLCFHKKNLEEAIEAGKLVIKKGYQLFMQPMVTTRYSNSEFQAMILRLQKELPEMVGFYVVDSFGCMRESDIEERMLLADACLREDIVLGLHAHNNLNCCMRNAVVVAELIYGSKKMSKHRVVNLDSSLFGMGKGAGNLSTEEIAEYLNQNYGFNYNYALLKEVSRKRILQFYETSPWGPFPEYELSAKFQLTPSYVKAFLKQVDNTQELERLLAGIPEEKKDSFDGEFAAEYLKKYASEVKE